MFCFHSGRAAFVLLALATWLGASAATCRAEPSGSRPVTVFAAASLKTVLDQAGATMQAAGASKPVISFAASSALAKQIEQGAPADVFISADGDWMSYLAGKGLVREGTQKVLATNDLVLVAPAASAVEIKLTSGVELASILGKDSRLAVADVAAVPAGKYAKAALMHLGAWDGVKDQLAQAENVRAALALVALGEAPLGIVYASDAAADARVRVVAVFPSDSHPRIIYPAAITTASQAPEAAGAFLAFLASDAGRALFVAHRFGLPD